MALTEPLDLLTGFPGWCTDFDLMARQEQSRHASGRTRTKDFGSPIWRASYQTRNLSPNQLDHWRAVIGAAEVDQVAFLGIPLSRCWPIEHPKGAWVDQSGWVLESGLWSNSGAWLLGMPWGANQIPDGVLHTIGDDDKSIRVSGLPGVRLSIGDMLQIGSNLHRVREAATGASDGLTPMFEIRPHLWPGTVTGQAVKLHKPACLMTIMPGSVSAAADPRTGRGSVSFSAIETRG